MASIGSITWESEPKDFLNPNETENLSNELIGGELCESIEEITSKITAEMDVGLSRTALNLEGAAPLNDLAGETITSMKKSLSDIDCIGNDIITQGNKHTEKEVDTYYEEVMKEYNKRKSVLRDAVNSYNGNRTVNAKGGKTDSEGNPIKETIPEIKIINGEDNNYAKVIISGKRDSRSPYYGAVEDALANVEKMYPKPETAHRYKVMWGNASTGSTGKTPTAADTNVWTSYADAITAGCFDIMTPQEFGRNKPAGYNTYQDYLNAMYTKYSASLKQLKYQPKIKNGEFNTKFLGNKLPILFNNMKYNGEYIEYYNENGMKVRAPLAIVKYENGEVVFVPMTEKQKKQYIMKVTKYYNDIMETKKTYTSKFRNEIGNRVDSTTLLYIDPDSVDKIKSVKGSAAYCSSTNGYSTHSDIVVYSNQYINLNDNADWQNAKESYEYMVGAYTHESGHAYANNKHILFLGDRDHTSTWSEVYNQVTSEKTNKDILREYSLKNKAELFADSTEYYYTDPDRLKQVEINVSKDGKKYETLYEYMDDELN